MFDVGFSELVLIGLIALLVVGPERLPPLVRSAGRWLGRAQRMARDLKRELERETNLQELTQLQQTLRQESVDLNAAAAAPPSSATIATKPGGDPG